MSKNLWILLFFSSFFLEEKALAKSLRPTSKFIRSCLVKELRNIKEELKLYCNNHSQKLKTPKKIRSLVSLVNKENPQELLQLYRLSQKNDSSYLSYVNELYQSTFQLMANYRESLLNFDGETKQLAKVLDLCTENISSSCQIEVNTYWSFAGDPPFASKIKLLKQRFTLLQRTQEQIAKVLNKEVSTPYEFYYALAPLNGHYRTQTILPSAYPLNPQPGRALASVTPAVPKLKQIGPLDKQKILAQKELFNHFEDLHQCKDRVEELFDKLNHSFSLKEDNPCFYTNYKEKYVRACLDDYNQRTALHKLLPKKAYQRDQHFFEPYNEKAQANTLYLKAKEELGRARNFLRWHQETLSRIKFMAKSEKQLRQDLSKTAYRLSRLQDIRKALQAYPKAIFGSQGIQSTVLDIQSILRRDLAQQTNNTLTANEAQSWMRSSQLFQTQHCFETYYLLKRFLGEEKAMSYSFQSRFGREEWLTPYTDEWVKKLASQGVKSVAIYCPSFVADCLETIDEIGRELKEQARQWGIEVIHIPCLNSEDIWCKDFAQFVKVTALGTQAQKEELFYEIEKEEYKHMTEQKLASPPMSKEAKAAIKVVFATLFMDLIGFSLIFPLFPALAKFYLLEDSDNFFLRSIFGLIQMVTSAGGDKAMGVDSIVLFGGTLGALYSFLQFVTAPLWGGLSDKWGRRPILLVSIFGLAISYFMWIFSRSFTVLILARFIGGIMGGSISTATAVIADVTSAQNRAKGMAFVGIAFALAFTVGPAIGGLASLIDITSYGEKYVAWGLHPFSFAAAIAFVLSMFNFSYIYRRFKESLPPEKRGKHIAERSANPLRLLKPLPYKGANATNIAYFLFLMAFSGMEFTLTFLAVERLSFSSMDNAMMFIFIGVVIALVQGGFVRRRAAQVGEQKMALGGILAVMPGLVCIAYAQSNFLLYCGLFFLSVGSAMIIPCLTALASRYLPAEYQGRGLGIFRSLGALARVLGPLVASILYWRLGANWPYLLGTAFLFLPLVLVMRLPKLEEVNA